MNYPTNPDAANILVRITEDLIDGKDDKTYNELVKRYNEKLGEDLFDLRVSKYHFTVTITVEGTGEIDEYVFEQYVNKYMGIEELVLGHIHDQYGDSVDVDVSL